MQNFFRAKRSGSVPVAILFVLCLTFLSILGSAYLSVGIGNPVNKVTRSLLSSTTFKSDAGTYFVSKALENAKGEERSLLLKKGAQISAAVTAFLGNPIFKSELDQISDIAYAYYSSGNSSYQSIDVKPVAGLALISLESVDSQFAQLKKELDKIKPIKLQPQKSGPNPAQVKSDLQLVLLLLFILSLITLMLYLRFARAGKAALRTLGIIFAAEGIFLVILNGLASTVLKNQATKATEPLAREAIPIVAHSLLASMLALGAIELIAGLIFMITSLLKRVNVNGQR